MSSADQQCRALTEDGERCGRTASDGEFCYQHDENDPTVDEEGSNDGSTDEGADRASAEDSTEQESESESDDGTSEAPEESMDGAGDLLTVQRTVQTVARELLDAPLDRIIEVGREDDEWRVTFEMVERRGVPDTQDILGRYEMTLDGPEDVSGYRRLSRYRRSDTSRQDGLE